MLTAVLTVPRFSGFFLICCGKSQRSGVGVGSLNFGETRGCAKYEAHEDREIESSNFLFDLPHVLIP